MVKIYDFKKTDYLEKLVLIIERDPRLDKINGYLKPYQHCVYKEGREIEVKGYQFSYMVQGEDFPLTNGLDFWTEENSPYIYIQEHILNHEVVKIRKEQLSEIEELILKIIKSKEKKMMEVKVL